MKTLKRTVTYVLKYGLGVCLTLVPYVINIMYGTPLYILIPITVLGMFLSIHAAYTIMFPEGWK